MKVKPSTLFYKTGEDKTIQIIMIIINSLYGDFVHSGLGKSQHMKESPELHNIYYTNDWYWCKQMIAFSKQYIY